MRVDERRNFWKVRVDEKRNFRSTTSKEVQFKDQTLQGFFDLEGETFSIEVCITGILREPWDFVAQDVNVGHPRSMFVHLNSEVTEMLRINFALDPHLVVKEKAQFASFGHYVARNSTVKRKPWASVFLFSKEILEA